MHAIDEVFQRKTAARWGNASLKNWLEDEKYGAMHFKNIMVS